MAKLKDMVSLIFKEPKMSRSILYWDTIIALGLYLVFNHLAPSAP